MSGNLLKSLSLTFKPRKFFRPTTYIENGIERFLYAYIANP